MSNRRETFLPGLMIVWVSLMALAYVLDEGTRPYIDFAPWWLRPICVSYCTYLVGRYIWRGRDLA